MAEIALEDREARRLFPVERFRFGINSVKMYGHCFAGCDKELQSFAFYSLRSAKESLII